MNACKNCKHRIKSLTDIDRCRVSVSHPAFVGRVDGKKYGVQYYSCWTERNSSKSSCGYAGVNFEQKAPSALRRIIHWVKLHVS